MGRPENDVRGRLLIGILGFDKECRFSSRFSLRTHTYLSQIQLVRYSSLQSELVKTVVERKTKG